MTIEFSLRRRATRSRAAAALWLVGIGVITVGTFVSLPFLAARTVAAVSANGILSASVGAPILRADFFVLATLVLSVLLVLFCCYLLGKAAFLEFRTAARLSGLADSLCIAADDIEKLGKARAIFVPTQDDFSTTSDDTDKKLKLLAEILKHARP